MEIRRIKSKSEEERKRKMNKIIVGVILIVVMLFSTLGYAFNNDKGDNPDSKKIKYNGYEFVNTNGFWILNTRGTNFIFQYNPKEVENISSDSSIKLIETYYNKPLYISSENSIATNEVITNLNQVVQRVQYACLDEKNCSEGLPVKTCSDNFIIIKKTNETSIQQNENCVFIEGNSEDITKVTDEFLFKILGVK